MWLGSVEDKVYYYIDISAFSPGILRYIVEHSYKKFTAQNFNFTK